MAVPAFDTLKLAERLEQAGFSASQARGTSMAFAEALSEQVPSKADVEALDVKFTAQIQDVKTELKSDIKSLDHKIDAINNKFDAKFDILDHKIDAIDNKFEAKFEALDHKFEALDHKFEALDHKFEAIEYNFRSLHKILEMIKWFVGSLTIGMFMVLLKVFWPM